MFRFFRNFILCGELDYFCLLCKESFQPIEELEKHIRWERHRKAIKTQNVLPKYKKDFVYKIEQYFYCEVCNFVTTEAIKMSDHVNTDDHKARKDNIIEVTRTVAVERRSDRQVGLPNTVVSMQEWLGIVSETCIFCNEPVYDLDDHVPTAEHMIKLIQSEIKQHGDEYYRKIDDKISYCFKCKVNFPTDAVANHCRSLKHTGEIGSESATIYEYDRENGTAKCKLCKKTIRCKLQFLLSHKRIHSDTDSAEIYKDYKYYDHGKRRHIMKEYGKDNFIKLNEGGSKGHCLLCNVYISAHINNLKQHVKGACHSGILEIRGFKPKTKKSDRPRHKTKTYKDFVKVVYHFKNTPIVWVNKNFPVNILSLMLLAPIGDCKKLKCYICGEVVPFRNILHYDSKHREDLLKIEIITSVAGELIREIKPNLYHCAYCNIILPSWKLMERHLECWKHNECKSGLKEFARHPVVTEYNPEIQIYVDYLTIVNIMQQNIN